MSILLTVNAAQVTDFKDVKPSAYYATFVEWAAISGIVIGCLLFFY